MLPEVEQYVARRTATQNEYDEALRVANNKLQADGRDYVAREAHTHRVEALAEVREAEFDAAWMRLGLSTDPLVAWAVQNMDEERWNTVRVLEILPATAAEIKAFAKAAGWCEEFDEWYGKAVDEGAIVEAPVVPSYTPGAAAEAAWDQLADWVRTQLSYLTDDVYNTLRGHVMAVAAAALADANTTPATDTTPAPTTAVTTAVTHVPATHSAAWDALAAWVRSQAPMVTNTQLDRLRELVNAAATGGASARTELLTWVRGRGFPVTDHQITILTGHVDAVAAALVNTAA